MALSEAAGHSSRDLSRASDLSPKFPPVKNRVLGHQLRARGFIDLCQAATHRVFTDHFLHARQSRVHRIVPQRGDMRVAIMASQHRQQHGADQIAFSRVRSGC